MEVVSSKNRAAPVMKDHGYEKFVANQKIYFRNHVRSAIHWVPGTIIRQHSQFIYEVLVNNVPRLVHVSTLRIRLGGECAEEVDTEEEWPGPRRSSRLSCT